jgi:muramoyltetrapeptide carboxypeptidase
VPAAVNRPLERPSRLQRGDVVAVVAPSGPVEEERLVRGCTLLESWGLQVRTGPHVLDRHPTEPHLAGTDADRAADLQWAMTDPAVAAVLCARGGTGAARVLPLLDWPALRAARPRAFVGFSDATALHQAFAGRLGRATLFGPMVAASSLGAPSPDQPSADHLRRTLFAPETARVLSAQRVTGPTRRGPGAPVQGVTVGGTVAVLAGLLGTAASHPAAGGIAVLEDVTEPTYRLDRTMTQLLQAGWFDGVRGVVLGSWEECDPHAAEWVGERLRGLGVPVLAGVPFGHGLPQLTVPLGAEAELDPRAGTLRLLAPALY